MLEPSAKKIIYSAFPAFIFLLGIASTKLVGAEEGASSTDLTVAAAQQTNPSSEAPATAAPVTAEAAAAAAEPDSTQAKIPASNLLPEVLSPGERLMWGEHGLMRGLFPLTEESREKELSLRRTMLTLHQIGGYTTLAAMITTVVFGQLTLDGHTSYGELHTSLASATIAAYAFTASMSLLSPPPMVRRKEWNTISIHKGLAWIHLTGMIATPLLADGIAEHERGTGTSSKTINRDKAQIHQISGYITTAAFAAAFLVVTF